MTQVYLYFIRGEKIKIQISSVIKQIWISHGSEDIVEDLNKTAIINIKLINTKLKSETRKLYFLQQ